MKTYPTLICFADGGNVDAITPAFDPRLAIEQALILHAPGELPRAQWLADVVADGDVSTRLVPLPPHSKFGAMRNAIGSVIAQNTPAIVNLSNADAARAAIAFEAARDAGMPACVVEPDTDRLQWLHAPEHFVGFDVAERITLDGYLAAHGFAVTKTEADLGDAADRLDDVARHLFELSLTSPETVQRFCQLMSFTGASSNLPVEGKKMRSVCAYLAERSLITINSKQRVVPNSRDYQSFLSGGWLERWLFRRVILLAGPGRLQAAARGLIMQSEDGISNELDVAVLNDNALYFAECKGISRSVSEQITNALFKLDSISSQHELQARPLLLTVNPPTDALTARARNLEIILIGGETPEHIDTQLRQWLQLPEPTTAR